MSVKTNPKEKILDLISKSMDKHLGGPKSIFRSESYLNEVDFSDVADVVLYYLSLRPDMRKICRIESYKFYKLLEETMFKWAKKAKQAWGFRYYEPSYAPGKKHKWFLINDVALHAWQSGSGPMGGTMGPAEHYAYLEAGFLQHDNLLILFSYPEELSGNGGTGNWPSYREHHIEKLVFPKWRREIHAQKLESVLQLAEMVCTGMRK